MGEGDLGGGGARGLMGETVGEEEAGPRGFLEGTDGVELAGGNWLLESLTFSNGFCVILYESKARPMSSSS